LGGLVKVLTPVRIGIAAVFTGLALGLFLWQPVWLLHSHALRTGNEMSPASKHFELATDVYLKRCEKLE
jgi:hypothetical protein